jgi:hypothetical protein
MWILLPTLLFPLLEYDDIQPLEWIKALRLVFFDELDELIHCTLL